MHSAVTWAGIKKYFPARKKGSHKGENGKVLVIAGSEGLAGAAMLAASSANSALRAGADLCTVAAPEKVGWAINTYSPDIIVKKFHGKFFSRKQLRHLLALEQNSDAALIGPGMGREKTTLLLARKFVQGALGKVVLDADALRACTGMVLSGKEIITPHEKEFETFSGVSLHGKALAEKINAVRMCAARHNCVILLKGSTDIISDGKKTFLNKTGNPGMTKGGTGDVLAGLCAAYIALGAKPLEAACAAAFVSGKIGDSLRKKMGYGFTASDMVKEVPHWTKRLLR